MHSIKDQTKKIGELGIIALAFVIPAFYPLDLPVLAIIGICLIIQGGGKWWKPFIRSPRIFLPIAFYLYMFAGFFFSHNFGEGMSSVSEKLAFLLYPLFIGCRPGLDKGLLHKARRAFILSLCIFLGAALLYAIGDMLITHNDMVRLGEGDYKKWSSFGLTRLFNDWHPTYVSDSCNLAIAFLLSRLILEKDQPLSRILRRWSFAAFLFLSVCIFLLYSVTGIVIYCCLLLYFGFTWLRQWRLPFIANLGIGLLLAGLLAGFLYANPLGWEKIDKLKAKEWKATDNYTERNVLTMRMAKWDTYLGIFRQHPIFGTTTGDIKDIRHAAYTKNGYADLALHNYNAHDQYVEILTVYGIAGFILFIAMLWTAFRSRQDNPLILPFLIISLIAFTTESILERQQGLHFFMFFYSFLTLRILTPAKTAPLTS